MINGQGRPALVDRAAASDNIATSGQIRRIGKAGADCQRQKQGDGKQA
ncbi:hypothetical protein [Desulfuromusa kysingii]|nr:hypothetical protein [Desulfuromusa kysingii]